MREEIQTDELPSREGLLESLWRTFVIRPVFWWQDMRCARAKAYLLTHDIGYRMQYAGLEVVRQREIWHQDEDSTKNPLDFSYPDQWSIEQDLPPMSWPRKNPFSAMF